eukprot:m.165122 g.165122  ORF g.165122 m.165122 type:complete len:217 (-) comp10322_c0_seq4:158-808(-)
MDIITGEVYDPLKGVDQFGDAAGGVEHMLATPMRIVPCAQNDEMLRADLGGRLRLFKLLGKRENEKRLYAVSKPIAEKICRMLLEDISPLLDTSPTLENMKHGELVFEKFAKKLTCVGRDIETRICKVYAEVEFLRADGIEVAQEWWSAICQAARLVVHRKLDLFSHYCDDSAVDRHVFFVLDALATHEPQPALCDDFAARGDSADDGLAKRRRVE